MLLHIEAGNSKMTGFAFLISCVQLIQFWHCRLRNGGWIFAFLDEFYYERQYA